MTDFKYEGKDLEAMDFAQNYHSWILNIFSNYLGKSVAEVGAGTGSLSELLLETKSIKQLVAIEPSQEMFKKLEETTRDDKRVVCLNDFFHNLSDQYLNHFDSIVYINVLEHIKDDSEELIEVNKSLKQGGHVCIFVPALQWLYSQHDKDIGHYRRYTKKYLDKILKDSGFEIVNIRYFDIIGILPWFLMFKVLNKELKPGNVSIYDKIIVPISRLLEAKIAPPIGKNLIAIAKKC